jgi:tetratricopeptide (TPR) repeat protein
LHNTRPESTIAAMPYVRRRGNHLAIVHGARDPETGKVDQQLLMTLHSKAEALAAIGRSSGSHRHSFRAWMEDRYPDIRFSWPKIDDAIDELKDELPDLAKSREDRAIGGFRHALGELARQLIAADPQTLDSARDAIETHRAELEWLVDLIDWRLEASALTKPSEFTKDPFGWRLALDNGMMDPELEEALAGRIDEGRLDEAESVFRFLLGIYPKYAEAWNYLGLIALRRGELPKALDCFETCAAVGRKLFPKRIAKRDYWTRLETRPYMRGLRNQWVVLNKMGRYTEALEIAARLHEECADDITAAVFRSITCLNTAAWQLALDAATYTAGLYAEQSLVAAYAAFELADLDRARSRFVHATLNHPHTVAAVLGASLAEPVMARESDDRQQGESLREDLSGYFRRRTSRSRTFFDRLWRNADLAALRVEAIDATRRMREVGRDDPDEYRRLYDRVRELGSRELAEQVAAGLEP